MGFKMKELFQKLLAIVGAWWLISLSIGYIVKLIMEVIK